VRRARNNFHFLFATQTRQGRFVHFDNWIVETTNNQQRRRLNFWQSVTGQVGAATARNNCADRAG